MVSPSPPSVLSSTPWETGPAKEGAGRSSLDFSKLQGGPDGSGGQLQPSGCWWGEEPFYPGLAPMGHHCLSTHPTSWSQWGSLQEGEAQAGRAYLSALARLRPPLPGHPPCLPTDSASRPMSCHPHVNPEGKWGSGGLWLPKDTQSVEGADFRPELWSVRLQWSHTLFNSPAVSQD